MRPRRVLVTGAAGFIGSHLVDRLLADGCDVAGVDDLSTGRKDNLTAAQAHGQRFRFDVMDLSDDAVTTVAEAFQPDAVAHLAAQTSVRDSVADPVLDASSNVIATVQVLEAARKTGVAKVVLATSGGCIYGEPRLDRLPVGEDAPTEPHSPYGASKLAAEQYLAVYGRLHGIAWTALALGNVYGPRQDPFGEAGVVAIFGRRMLAGEPCVVYGDGSQTRDFIHVDDVADAFVLALDSEGQGRLNIGSGRGTSVTELFTTMAELAGYEQSPQRAPERPGELRHISLDASRAAEWLGWQPRIELGDGLDATLAWLARHN